MSDPQFRDEDNGETLVVVNHSWEDDQMLTVSVVEALAVAKETTADQLETRLYDVVDPDALEQFFEPTDESTIEAEVQFGFAGHTVVVRNTGEILVRGHS